MYRHVITIFLPAGKLRLHSGPKMGFRPGRGPLPMPNFTFIAAEIWEYSPKTVKICNFRHKFAPQGRLVCRIIIKFLAFVPVYSSLLVLPRDAYAQRGQCRGKMSVCLSSVCPSVRPSVRPVGRPAVTCRYTV